MTKVREGPVCSCGNNKWIRRWNTIKSEKKETKIKYLMCTKCGKRVNYSKTTRYFIPDNLEEKGW